MHNAVVLALALVLSTLGLALGPALVAASRGRGLAMAAADGLTLGLVPALVLTRLLPHVYDAIGPAALALAAVGFASLQLADRYGHRNGARVGAVVVGPALALHAAADGASLAVAVATAGRGDRAGVLLGAALLVHRLPEGLFLATALVPELGWRRTARWFAAIALATVAGAVAQRALLAWVPDALIDAVVAFGLGAMLRLVTHSHAPPPRRRAARALSGATFALGLLVALALPSPHGVLARAQPRELSWLQAFGPLFVETAPAVLIGLALGAAAHALARGGDGAWLRRGSVMAQVLRGLRHALPPGACSCDGAAGAERRLRAGAPAAAVVAFALGAPALGPVSALLSLRLLGLRFTLARLAAGALVALVVAVVVGRVAPRPRFRFVARTHGAGVVAPRAAPNAAPSPTRRADVRAALRAALDHAGAWYLAGLVAAAALEAAVDPSRVARLHSPLDALAAAALAAVAYVGPEGATPLAAVFVHKGLGVGAAVAFLVVGAGANPRLLGVLRATLGTRAVVAFVGCSVACAVALGVAATAVVPRAALPAIHALVAHQHAPAEWACAGVLALLVLGSLLRLGPRAWLATITARGAGLTHEA